MSELGIKLIQGVRRAARNRPNNTAGGMYENPESGKLCILGDAMHQEGILKYVPPGCQTTGIGALARFNNIELPGELNDLRALTTEELMWLRIAQNCNDSGETWEECVRRADVYFGDALPAVARTIPEIKPAELKVELKKPIQPAIKVEYHPESVQSVEEHHMA